jgi:hypothetical protein
MSLYSKRNMMKLSIGALGTFGLALTPYTSHAATQRVAVNAEGVAIDGYDTTAYWTDASARAGGNSHTVQWRGTTWQFQTAENAAQFEAAPDTFAPKFGGFCTRAMSFKKIVNGDPEVWRIYQGNLYLFAQPVGGKKFDKGQDAMIAKAQAYWDTLD